MLFASLDWVLHSSGTMILPKSNHRRCMPAPHADGAGKFWCRCKRRVGVSVYLIHAPWPLLYRVAPPTVAQTAVLGDRAVSPSRSAGRSCGARARFLPWRTCVEAMTSQRFGTPLIPVIQWHRAIDVAESRCLTVPSVADSCGEARDRAR